MKRILIAWFLLWTSALVGQTGGEEANTKTVLSESQLALVATTGERRVTLKWATARDFTNRMFFLERSLDGELYTVLTQIKGRKSTGAPRLYEFVDGSVENRENYCYRIVSSQLDGKIAVGESVWITVSPVLTEMQH